MTLGPVGDVFAVRVLATTVAGAVIVLLHSRALWKVHPNEHTVAALRLVEYDSPGSALHLTIWPRLWTKAGSDGEGWRMRERDPPASGRD